MVVETGIFSDRVITMRQADRSTFWFVLSSPYFVPVCFIAYLTVRPVFYWHFRQLVVLQ